MKRHRNNNPLISLFIIVGFALSIFLYGCWIVLGVQRDDLWMAAIYNLALTFVLMFWDVVRMYG